MATVELEKFQNCDRPLGEEERGEMSIERQRGALESLRLLQKEPTNGERRESHSDSNDKSKADAESAV